MPFISSHTYFTVSFEDKHFVNNGRVLEHTNMNVVQEIKTYYTVCRTKVLNVYRRNKLI